VLAGISKKISTTNHLNTYKCKLLPIE